jgi:hypothetical protein
MKSTYEVLARKNKGKRLDCGGLGINWMIILK